MRARFWLKGGVCAVLCAMLILSMCACGGRELYERMIIHGIGVDSDGEEFEVTVRSSVSPEDGGEELLRCRGRSVPEALNSLALSTGRKPFYAHNYLVVFGRECAERGLDRCIDFFVRYYNTRPAVQLYVADGDAEEILSFERDGRYLKMSELQQLGDSSRDTGRTVGVEVLDFINGVKRQGGSAVAPVLRADRDKIEICASAYFDGYKLKNMLDLNATRGFLAVKSGLTDGEAVIKTEEHGTVTLTLSDGRGGIELDLTGELPRFLLKINVAGDVSAVSGGRNTLEHDGYDVLEAELEKELRGETEAAIEQAVISDGCDIFGFGALIYRKAPRQWEGLKEDWSETMKKCGYDIEASADVKRLEQEELGKHTA